MNGSHSRLRPLLRARQDLAQRCPCSVAYQDDSDGGPNTELSRTINS